ncbi:hypothetical protein BSLG_001641 [Batrachochytrium salamandrivorans]|nr:hypothetical protein BSLG_001641 [Batrachochytrium salamandrivorans]
MTVQRATWLQHLHRIRLLLKTMLLQSIAHIVSTQLLLLLVSSALCERLVKLVMAMARTSPHKSTASTLNAGHYSPVLTIDESHIKPLSEPIPSASPSIEHYIHYHGYDAQRHIAITPDGFVLPLFRILKRPNATLLPSPTRSVPYGSKGPVLLVHGLFQSSGVFVTSGQSSLAFYLTEAGFDVWLGNNRCCEELHLNLSPNSTEFWDWSLDELARYDFPTMIEFVATKTQYEKITFIGHSQGNAQAFLGLSMNPSIAERLRCFIALAPAVYTGPLLRRGPTGMLMGCSSGVYQFIFGIKAFLPIMITVQKYVPSSIFATMAYGMFHHLFKCFRLGPHLPRQFSIGDRIHNEDISVSLVHCKMRPITFQPPDQLDILNLAAVTCPLVTIYGRRDLIVDGDRLARECRLKNLNVLYSEHIDEYEHLDVIWASTAPQRVFSKLVSLVNSLPLQ